MVGGTDENDFNLRHEEKDQAFYAVRSMPGSRLSQVYDLERHLDAKYLLEGYSGSKPQAGGDDDGRPPLPYRLKVCYLFRDTLLPS